VSNKGKGPSKVLRCAEVMHRTGLSKATIYRLMDRGLFPLRRPLCSGAVGWSEPTAGGAQPAAASQQRAAVSQSPALSGRARR
jgi:predicted DNA-binding transcriptional regulator AlpA